MKINECNEFIELSETAAANSPNPKLKFCSFGLVECSSHVWLDCSIWFGFAVVV